jgi:hypothetical protein
VLLVLRQVSVLVKIMDHHLVVVQCDVEVVAEAVVVRRIVVAVAAEVVVVVVIVVVIKKNLKKEKHLLFLATSFSFFVLSLCIYIYQ